MNKIPCFSTILLAWSTLRLAFPTAALADPQLDPSPRLIQFSGYEWQVKSGGTPLGPGPNYFSADPAQVWVDPEGRLHLTISQRNGRWYCSEIVSRKSFGHGSYHFYLQSPVSDLDRNAVLGLFTWSDDPSQAHREIDIEFARWGDPKEFHNAQYVVQPYQQPGHMLRFTVPSLPQSILTNPTSPPGPNQSQDAPTLHSFTWLPNLVRFRSVTGHAREASTPNILIREWTFSQTVPELGDEQVRLNLWLVRGQAPSDGRAAEVVVSKFEFHGQLPPTRP